ncbi:uncharacterized protein ANIA_11594 [Aspergillus nidulans FGSC A4]|uniref:Uncharacterized protein n=1 Tax=Emericella nidulans (strain FGSC A4 / ATCC 38163 / CBS 112.46 / NRRL 194 / M139) TaxID=227321 RepID=C8V6Z0_EMENI|nr:hypothetical protein [Aspergillus nidulans FGSC A4]CBF74041.1 TPA: hypothetical protein ANIA_11594 [Aspergillus nidulans FGSC A4]
MIPSSKAGQGLRYHAGRNQKNNAGAGLLLVWALTPTASIIPLSGSGRLNTYISSGTARPWGGIQYEQAVGP